MNVHSTPLTLDLQVLWADGAPASTERITVAPRSRWERNLAQYRDTSGNLNASVLVTGDKVTAVFVAIWFGANYARDGGYGYWADKQCAS